MNVFIGGSRAVSKLNAVIRMRLDHLIKRGCTIFIGDANGEILWRDSSGDIALWGVQNGQVTSSSGLGTVTGNFVVQGGGDFNGDGKLDILWRDTNSGALSIWLFHEQRASEFQFSSLRSRIKPS